MWPSPRPRCASGAAPCSSGKARRASKDETFFCANLDVGTRDPSDNNSGLCSVVFKGAAYALQIEGPLRGNPAPPCFLSDISGWSLSLGGGAAARRADMQQSDPLAPPACRRRRFLFRECRIGATMAPARSAAPGELSDLRGRRAQHPDRDRTHRGVSLLERLRRKDRQAEPPGFARHRRRAQSHAARPAGCGGRV